MYPLKKKALVLDPPYPDAADETAEVAFSSTFLASLPTMYTGHFS
jgi:hypothetical protein